MPSPPPRIIARHSGLAAAIAGLLIGLCWQPFGAGPLYPAGFLLYGLAFETARSGRDALRLGAFQVVGRFVIAGHTLLALLSFTPAAILFYLLALCFYLLWALLQAGLAFWLARRSGLPRIICLGVSWGLTEKLQTLGDLSFPADMLAHGLGPWPAFLAPSSATGPLFVPLWAGLVAWLLARSIAAAGASRLAPAAGALAAALALWAAPSTPDLVSPRAAGPKSIRVGVVQPFALPEEKQDRERWTELWSRTVELSRSIADESDLLIWPETARPGAVRWEEGRLEEQEVGALARELGRPILYGTLAYRWRRGPGGSKSGRIYNGALLARADGSTVDWYGKQRLLPLAEGVPFGELFGWDPSRRSASSGYLTMLGNFSRGPQPTIFEVGPARIGVLICYEGMYPGLAANYRRAGANVLAVLTNDAWWGRTVFPRWHALLAAARAREADLPVVRAANNGVSCVIDRRGRVLRSTRLGEVTAFTADLPLADSPPTFYARHGDWILLVYLIPVAIALFKQMRPRSRSERGPAAEADSADLPPAGASDAVADAPEGPAG